MRTAALPLLALLVAAPARADGPEVYRVDLGADAAVTGAALAGAGALELLAPRIVGRRCPCDRGEVPGFDRLALDRRSGAARLASDATLAAALALPPALDLLALGDGRALRQDLVVYGETLAVAAAVAQGTKVAVQRPRPRTYAGDPAFLRATDGYASFYSGHTTLTAAALAATAMTARARYGERVWPWLVAGAVTASVGAERVLAGRHFPSDVAAGALTGLAVGVAVPWLHRGTRPGALTLAPNPGAPGLALAYRP